MILSSPDKTGMTTHTFDLSVALVKLGHSVTVLTGVDYPYNSEQMFFLKAFQESGVRVVVVRRGTGFVTNLHQTLKSLFVIAQKWDIIHVQSPYYSFMPWLCHKKFVSTLHVNDLVRCFYYKNATRLIAISKETKEYAKKVFAYDDKDITIINHGVSLRFATTFSEEEKILFKKERHIPCDKIIIGLVASIEKRKGHDILLKAIYNLPQNIKSKIHVVFVGSSKDGRTNGWLQELIDQYGEGRITCFPYQDPESYYKIFDIFVLPSRLEGFGLVVVEAMLSGCCVLRSNTEGAYEQIDSGVNGFIFENENIEQLTDLLSTLMQDSTLMHRIAKAGKEKALKEFTSEVMARKTLEVYKKVMS